MFKILKKINISASYAINGLIGTFKEEFMMRVQATFGLIQFVLAILLGAEIQEIVLIFLIWIILISQESMNTGIENLTDLVTDKEQKHLAKRAKDSAGGAVFIVSVASWIIFIVLVFDEVKELFM